MESTLSFQNILNKLQNTQESNPLNVSQNVTSLKSTNSYLLWKMRIQSVKDT